jgi:ribonuclease H / adenosylcobalamin/alpha-ribazole phosphatase
LNEDNKFRSRMDPPLDDQGVQQAETAAESIANGAKGVQRVVSSPLLRAVQTADTIAERLGLTVEQDRGLISWDLGFLSGKDKDSYNDILNMYVDNPKLAVPEGEPLEALEQRTFDFFDKELRSGQLTVYVTHTSNIITVENLIHGNHDGRPEAGETTVEPGGCLGVFVDSEGNYSTEVLFGVEKEATFGS